MAKITVLYAEGEPKKHSVRFKPQSCNVARVDIRYIGDIYVSRDLLRNLGGDFDSTISLTYELAVVPEPAEQKA